MCRYEKADPYVEFPTGMKIIFYNDSTHEAQTEITANYGINYTKSKIMEAKNNVVVINYAKQEELNTERLVWDQNRGVIYSDVFVKITRNANNEVIYGDGLESDESFEKYVIKNPSGVFEVDQDE